MKTRFFTDEKDGTVFVIIDHEDGSFVSMPKEVYDEMKKAQDGD